MSTKDTLQDVAVVLSGHGTVDVMFRPADGGIGTHMRVVSKPQGPPTAKEDAAAPAGTPHAVVRGSEGGTRERRKGAVWDGCRR
ncbi:hypothetical protein FA95DRAFT_1614251 [Auriscalpium vulgare]|uniref:Uncharacterized protein n=1 Tax=Auriscalpium vulgare TaxID=40419 RepID=A0ACB8R094_9AGAM|nr:hypothetical protein FA95DRAFT_1614251 [Auriscalpium vulgare]